MVTVVGAGGVTGGVVDSTVGVVVGVFDTDGVVVVSPTRVIFATLNRQSLLIFAAVQLMLAVE